MHSSYYNGYTADGEAICLNCIDKNYEKENQDVLHPIFADSEWDYYPNCAYCDYVFDYVNLTPRKSVIVVFSLRLQKRVGKYPNTETYRSIIKNQISPRRFIYWIEESYL